MFKTVAIIAALVTTAPAFAKSHAWQVGNDSMHIYYDDLDVKTTDGRALLLQRVERAMARLCRDAADPRDCVAVAVRQAAALPGGGDVQLALAERTGTRLAAR